MSELMQQAANRVQVSAARMVTGATRQRRRRALAVTAASAAVVTAMIAGVTLLTTPDGTVPPGPSSGSPETPAQRQADIYTAVLKESVNVLGAVPSVVYVQDRAEGSAGVSGGDSAGESVPAEVQAAVTAIMSDTATIEWTSGDGADLLVQNRNEELAQCFSMRTPNSVFITLDTLLNSGRQDEVTVSVTREEGNSPCAVYSFNTYIVEEAPEGWEITGYTTPVGIS